MSFSILLEKKVSIDSTQNKKGENVLFVDRIDKLFSSETSNSKKFIAVKVRGSEKIFENLGTFNDPVISVNLSNGSLSNNVLVHLKEGKSKLELNKQSLTLFREKVETNIVNTWNNKEVKKTITEGVVKKIFEEKVPTVGVMSKPGFKESKKKKVQENTIYKTKLINLKVEEPIIKSKTDEYVKEEKIEVDIDKVNSENYFDKEYTIDIEANKNKPASWYLEPYVPVEYNINFVDIFKRELLVKECIKNKIAIRVEAFRKIYKEKDQVSVFVDSKNNIIEIKNNNDEPKLVLYKGRLAGYPIIDGTYVTFVTEEFTDTIVDGNKKIINLVRNVVDSTTGIVSEQEVIESYYSSPLNFTPVTQEMYFSAPSKSKRFNFTVNSKEKLVRIVDVMTGKSTNITIPISEIFSYTPYFDGNDFVLNTAALKDTSDVLPAVGYEYKTRRYSAPNFVLKEERVTNRVEQFSYYVKEARQRLEDESTSGDGDASTKGDTDSTDPYPFLALINDNTIYMKLIREPTTPIKRITYIEEVFDDDVERRINPPSGYIVPPPSP